MKAFSSILFSGSSATIPTNSPELNSAILEVGTATSKRFLMNPLNCKKMNVKLITKTDLDDFKRELISEINSLLGQ